MFTREQLNPARNIGESFPAYRRRRIAVARAIDDHLRSGVLLYSSMSGPLRAGRNIAKRERRARSFA